MNKKLFFTFLALGVISSLGSAIAIDTSRSGMIIDNFKARHEKILFETMSFTETGANEILEYEYRMN